MTIIANPIYDSVFKFLMEDNKVARILLSALLKKDIVELEMRRHEYSTAHLDKISLFRIDFAARIRNADGSENLILIELQKTWLPTETLRFRQYLGTQYLDQNNMVREAEVSYGLPIIVVYLLGHKLGELTEPVIYVRRRYLDYDDQVLDYKDPFIESLTHDAVIVLLPFLQGRMRNHLERLLSVFDQEYRMEDEHYLELPVEEFPGDEQAVLVRLLKAATTPDVRRQMDVEDEIRTVLQDRETAILLKDQEIQEKEQKLNRKDQELGMKDRELGMKDQELGMKDRELGMKDQELKVKDRELEEKKEKLREKELEIKEKDRTIEEREQLILEKEKMLRKMVSMLHEQGMFVEEIAQNLSISVETILLYFKNYNGFGR